MDDASFQLHLVIAASSDDRVWLVDPRRDGLVAQATPSAEVASPVLARLPHAAALAGSFPGAPLALARRAGAMLSKRP